MLGLWREGCNDPNAAVSAAWRTKGCIPLHSQPQVFVVASTKQSCRGIQTQYPGLSSHSLCTTTTTPHTCMYMRISADSWGHTHTSCH
jgi:hypothetical protein